MKAMEVVKLMSRYNLINGYVGSKAPFADKIKAFFDVNCTRYVEAFVGGGAIYFSMPNGRYEKEVLNDCDVNLMSIYSALTHEETRKKTVEQIYKIEKPEDVELATELWKKAKKELLPIKPKALKEDEELMVKYAVNAYKVFTQSFNSAGKSYSAIRNNEEYRRDIRDSIPQVLSRLKSEPKLGVGQAINVIERYVDDPKAQLFCDPPYIGQYRNSRKLYLSEMSSLLEHIKLAQALANAKAAVVLCGYRSPIGGVPTIYDAILSGEQWHCYKLADTYKKAMVVGNGVSKQKCQEFIWTNRVPDGAKYRVSMVDYMESLNIDEYWASIREHIIKGMIDGPNRKEYEITYKKLYGKDLMKDLSAS